MTRHLSEADLSDLLLGDAAPPPRAHAAACALCRERLEGLRASLATAREAELPEPSPLYWDALRGSVQRRIAEEPAPSRWRWRPLLALAAAGAIALVTLLPRRGAEAPALPAWSALPPVELDVSFAVLEGLEPAWDDVAELGVCAGVDRCLLRLSEDESGELAEALRAELGRRS